MFFKKKLVTVGDSFTDNYLKSQWHLLDKKPYLKNVMPFKIWPELLSEKLNLKLINLGQCGRGNEYIFNKSVDVISKHNDIELMVVLWTEFQRFDFEYGQVDNYRTANIDNGTLHFTDIEEYLRETFKYEKIYTMESAFNRFMRLSYALDNICKNENINLIQGFGVCPYNWGYTEKPNIIKLSELFLKHKLSSKMENHLGYPFFTLLNGFCIADKMKTEHCLHPTIDPHPNKEGSKFMYEIIYDFYLKNIKK